MSCCRRKAPFDCRYKGCRCAVCGMDFASFDKADPIVVTLEGIDSDCLESESGGDASIHLDTYFEIIDEMGIISDFKFRYIEDLDLSQYPITHLPKKGRQTLVVQPSCKNIIKTP